MKEDESLPQDHADQAANEIQSQTAEEAEPMTVHFAVNCKLQSFLSSHEYQQNISHWSNTFYVPLGPGQIWGMQSRRKPQIFLSFKSEC